MKQNDLTADIFNIRVVLCGLSGKELSCISSALRMIISHAIAACCSKHQLKEGGYQCNEDGGGGGAQFRSDCLRNGISNIQVCLICNCS